MQTISLQKKLHLSIKTEVVSNSLVYYSLVYYIVGEFEALRISVFGKF